MNEQRYHFKPQDNYYIVVDSQEFEVIGKVYKKYHAELITKALNEINELEDDTSNSSTSNN